MYLERFAGSLQSFRDCLGIQIDIKFRIGKGNAGEGVENSLERGGIRQTR